MVPNTSSFEPIGQRKSCNFTFFSNNWKRRKVFNANSPNWSKSAAVKLSAWKVEYHYLFPVDGLQVLWGYRQQTLHRCNMHQVDKWAKMCLWCHWKRKVKTKPMFQWQIIWHSKFSTYTIYGVSHRTQTGPSCSADSTIAGYVRLGTCSFAHCQIFDKRGNSNEIFKTVLATSRTHKWYGNYLFPFA